MTVPSQAQPDSNAPSPPLTPNPDPQSRDETPTTQTNEHGIGRKRSQTAAASSPKRQRVEDITQGATFSQQRTHRLHRQSNNGVGLRPGQQEHEDDTLRSALVEAQAPAQPQTVQTNTAEAIRQAQMRTQLGQSPIGVQSPGSSNVPMPPPPPIPTAALAHRRTSGSPAMRQGAWGVSSLRSVSQSPTIGLRQVQSRKYLEFPVQHPSEAYV